MDMFVDLIDSQLQDPEDYALLRALDMGKTTNQPYLNKLLNVTTELVMSSNNLPTGLDYSVASTHQTYGSMLTELSKKTEDAIQEVEKYVLQTYDDHDDLNIDGLVMEFLSEEVQKGIDSHNEEPQQSVSSSKHRRSRGRKKLASQKKKVVIQKASEKTKPFDPEVRLHKLNLEYCPSSYPRLLKQPQRQWMMPYDNFSMLSMYRPEIPKFNPVQGSPDMPSQPYGFIEDFGYERKFVPMLYPRYQYTQRFTHQKRPVSILPHPYIAEINALVWSEADLDHSHRGRKTLGGGTLTNRNLNAAGPLTVIGKSYMVETLQELHFMIEQLRDSEVIAIDVEHHSQQSFRGFVCLVQVTGAGCDWIIDPFGIFKDMWYINEITTNPRILKIMHGAESDVIWLQRDFGVYIVNMFDTLKASEICAIEGGHSLAALLRNLLGIHVDKSFQLADWRVRPLPKPMLNYASGDTHYLLDLYNVLKNYALDLDASLGYKGTNGTPSEKIQRIMHSSRRICLKQYREYGFNAVNRALGALRKTRQNLRDFDYLSLNLLINFMSLRNYAARALDESETFLFPDTAAVMMSIAGASNSTSAIFLQAVTKHLPLLEKEIPYIVNLRNNILDALEIIESSGVEFVEPIPLSTIGVFVCQEPTKPTHTMLCAVCSGYQARARQQMRNKTAVSSIFSKARSSGKVSGGVNIGSNRAQVNKKAGASSKSVGSRKKPGKQTQALGQGESKSETGAGSNSNSHDSNPEVRFADPSAIVIPVGSEYDTNNDNSAPRGQQNKQKTKTRMGKPQKVKQKGGSGQKDSSDKEQKGKKQHVQNADSKKQSTAAARRVHRRRRQSQNTNADTNEPAEVNPGSLRTIL